MTTPARSVALLQAGMTHAECARLLRCAWGDITLEFYVPTTGFYKEGWPPPEESWTRAEDVLRVRLPATGRPAPPDAVLISGMMSSAAREKAVMDSFGLYPDFAPRFGWLRGLAPSTLDAMQEFIWEQRAKFVARHGREPGVNDSFAGLG